jgi:N4-(beta-N-acetylglucosaminyl)-L-asparaginase
MSITRRGFLGSTVAASLAAGLNPQTLSAQDKDKDKSDARRSAPRTILVCAYNGLPYLNDAYQFLKTGGDTLDAAIRVVNGPENDPFEDSVGLGGLPNEEGVVELDACCMHGPTRRAGSRMRRTTCARRPRTVRRLAPHRRR